MTKASGGNIAQRCMFYAVIVVLNLVALEVLLRVADFALLRVTTDATLHYDHDPELGWVPVPGESAGGRTNSLGLRDEEPGPADRPTILFMGDSLVHGIGVSLTERFTDRLRAELPAWRIVNAGVVGYGTDQQLIWLQRLWPIIKPVAVVLIVCVSNDHDDNSTNSRYGHTLKPYLANLQGRWTFQGQPVPIGPRWYFSNNLVANHSALVRAGIVIYTRFRHPVVTVPDPTDHLVHMMRAFVEAQGARFFVGLQLTDRTLEPFLREQNIPFVQLAGAATLANGIHWNPEGHATVAARLKTMLMSEGLIH